MGMQEGPDRGVAREDALLLAAVASGDEKAFETLFDREAPLIYKLFMRMLRSVEDAEEVLQEVLLVLWNAQPEGKLQEGETLDAWVVNASRDRALVRIRSKGQRKPPPGVDLTGLTGKKGAAAPPGSPQEVREAMDALSQEEKKILALALYEGATDEEIAAIVRVKRPVVHERLGKALGSLAPGDRTTPATGGEPPYDHQIGLSAASALGVLTGEELRQFEAHRSSGCPLCREEAGLWTEAIALLAAALPDVALPADLKERVVFAARLSQVARDQIARETEEIQEEVEAPPEAPEPERERTSIPWLSILFGVFLGAATLGGGYTVVSLLRTVNQEGEKSLLQEATITKLLDELERKDALLRVLASTKLEVIALEPQPVNPTGYGRIFWDPTSKEAVLQVSQLPPTGPDQEYQLWIATDTQPVSGGVFRVSGDLSKKNFFRVQSQEILNRGAVRGFSVTQEAAGGARQPTGGVYLEGKPTARSN